MQSLNRLQRHWFPSSSVVGAAGFPAAFLCAIVWPSTLHADPDPLLNLCLDQLGTIKVDTVYAASKFTEKVTDAPSSVTIVTRDQIQHFGYRTLADVIRSVRGFDVTYDRAYNYTGVRGFISLDNYGSRVLLLIDGHRMNDPIFDTAAVGTPALLDIDLSQRVEFIRGPGSAIYGSNAFFGVINVITRNGASVNGVEVSSSAGSLDTYRGRRVTLGKKLDNGIEYLFSGSYYDSAGQTRLFFKEFAYADGHLDLTKELSLAAGVRWDHYDSFGTTVNPRTARIWKPRDGTSLKFLYGQAFRAPNVYQLYYSASNQSANPSLKPETIRTYEIAADQYFGTNWRGTISLFRNEISDLIETCENGSGFLMFTNSAGAHINGAEAEIEGRWDNGILARASYTRQQAISDIDGKQLVNSPANVFKGHLTLPLYRDKVFGSIELLYASDRLTLLRNRTGSACLVNTTLFSRNLLPNLEASASVFNLFNQKYATPGGPEHLQDSLIQNGRTFLLKSPIAFN